MVYHRRTKDGAYHQPLWGCISSRGTRASQLRNDDIQFLTELVIYKDFVFDDIHGFAVIRKRKFKSIRLFVENIFLPPLTHAKRHPVGWLFVLHGGASSLARSKVQSPNTELKNFFAYHFLSFLKYWYR